MFRSFARSALIAVALPLVVGCGAERPLPVVDDGQYEALPEGAVRIGDRWVRSASMNGVIAGQDFNGTARVRGWQDDYGNTVVELALPTDRAAVMHLVEFDAGLFDALAPGDTLRYAPEQDVALWPAACAGPELDAWEVDVAIEEMDMVVTPGPQPSTLQIDWTLKQHLDGLDGLETSFGQMVVDDPAALARGE